MMAQAADTDRIAVSSASPEQTERIGRTLMELLPDGALVALRGELGAGKTTFVRGMAQAIDAAELVTSPTFTIVHEYSGRRPFYHLDLYRITEPRQVLDLGYEELFTPARGVCVVEWPERAAELLPRQRVDIRIEHVRPDVRRIEVTNRDTLTDGWEARLQS